MVTQKTVTLNQFVTCNHEYVFQKVINSRPISLGNNFAVGALPQK